MLKNRNSALRHTLALFVAVLCLSFHGRSQTTFAYTDPEDRFLKARTLAENGQYALAYPLFQELSIGLRPEWRSDRNYLYDDILYFQALCGLQLRRASAEKEATDFLASTVQEVRKGQLSFHLAHYLYGQERFEEAGQWFERVRIDNLNNQQIADYKFEWAYSLFRGKAFPRAKALFGEIIQIEHHPHRKDALYYHGFIAYGERSYAEALSDFRRVEREPEYNAVVPYYVAEICYSSGQKKESLAYADSVLAAGGGSYYKEELRLLAAQLYFEKRAYGRALPLFETYVAARPKVSKEVLYELSFCYYQLNRPAKAIEGFKELSNEKDSLGQNSMYLLGELYLRIPDKRNARTAFKYCSDNTSNAEQRRVSAFQYAKLSYDLGFRDQAMQDIRQFLADFPESEYDAEAKEILMSLLAGTSDYGEGIAIYRSLNQATPAAGKTYVRLLHGRAIQWMNEQRLSEADDLFTQIMAHPQGAEVTPYARFWKGDIAYRQHRYAEALVHLQAFLDSKAPAQGEVSAARARYNMAYAWIQQGEFKKALAVLEPVLPVPAPGNDPIQQDMYLRAADCHYMNRDFSRAATMYDKAIQCAYQQSEYAHFQKAMIAGIGNSKEKLRLLQAFIRQYPSGWLNREARMEMAFTWFTEEKYEEAIPVLEQLLADPQAQAIRPKALLRLGLARYNRNDNRSALETLKKLVAEYPQSTETEEALSVIRDIYVEDGTPDRYVSFMKQSGFSVSNAEADSLMYVSAYMKYEAGEAQQASLAFDQYLKDHPQGQHVVDAGYYKALSQLRLQDTVSAISTLEKVVALGPSRHFEPAHSELARIYYFRNKDYASARRSFEAMYRNSSDPEIRREGLRGMVRSCYQTGEFTAAEPACSELLSLKGISNDDKAVATLVLARARQTAGDTLAASEGFRTVAALSKSLWGAEARYELAAEQYRRHNTDAAEKTAMSVIREAAVDPWLTRTYLLLGDIFMKQKDYFNAKATYESIAVNAADPVLRQEAQARLETARTEEQKNSRITP